MSETDKPKIGALAPWFGGKRTMAPFIVEQLGKHTQYFEPFCGSMAVLFAKEPSQKETVNDMHGHLVNLARVVQRDDLCPKLYDRLDRTLLSEGSFNDAANLYFDGFESEEPDLDAAYTYFCLSWMGRNGIAGSRFGKRGANHCFAVRWTNGGGSPTVRLQHAVDSIPSWHTRLKNVTILQRDAMEILDRPDDVETTAIYVDSPYVPETRSGFVGTGGHSRYVHELNHEKDHAIIAEKMRLYKKARIVVSYYDCELIRELYSGWTFIDHSRHKHLHGSNGRGHRPKLAPEVLIVNGESFAKTTNQLFT